MQPLIQVGPTDVDPVLGARNSTYAAPDFANVWQTLAGTNFRNALNANPAARGNFTFAFLDNALAAAAQDVPSLATAMINAITPLPAVRLALAAHRANLEEALGAHAHTNAGAGDVANFGTLINAGGVVRSRAKQTPNTMAQATLNGTSLATNTALNLLIAQLTARNNLLNDVTQYVAATRFSRARANTGMAGIRSPHQNGAGWLLPFAAPAAALEAALLVAANAAAINLQAEARASRVALGVALAAAAAGAVQASDVEDNVDASGNVALQNYFYRSVFWSTVPTKRARVILAWARYATDSGNMADCPYIEFAGGGLANRIIWDYVNDSFYISVHYNWVDGYNPFFEITGTQRTY